MCCGAKFASRYQIAQSAVGNNKFSNKSKVSGSNAVFACEGPTGQKDLSLSQVKLPQGTNAPMQWQTLAQATKRVKRAGDASRHVGQRGKIQGTKEAQHLF
jgi:hypothetical protein